MSERAWYRSLYWRIALGFILFLAAMLVVQGVLFVWSIERAGGAFPSHTLVELANVIATDMGNELEHNPGVNLDTYLREHYGQMSRRVFLFMPGNRVYGSHGRTPSPAVQDAEREWLAQGAHPEAVSLGFRSGRVVAFARILVNGKAAGFVAVQPGGPTGRVLREFFPTMLGVAVVLVLGGTALAALLIFGPAQRRLKGLEDAARRFGAGESQARAPIDGGDEIASVARAFNRMADDLALRASELQASDQARRQLLADVSHELTTPLTAIRGYVETLTLPDLALDEATRRRYLGIIEEETQRLETIVGDLLDLARLSAGGGTLKVQVVRVKDLFDRVMSRHERRSQDKQVTMTADIQAGAEQVTGDGDRLEQALQNLAANALRHTPAGGCVKLSAVRADNSVVLQVRDSGEGIPPEHIPMIFDRFYKVDAARTGSAAGSGLGLSIVRAIVERHGGTITVTSQPGVETVFEIRLPAEQASPAGQG